MVEVEKVATPLPLSVSGTAVPPSTVKFTVPVGVAVDGASAVTVAVKVTDWPNTDEVGDAVGDVVVSAWPTAWPPAREPPLPTKLVSAGLYVADTGLERRSGGAEGAGAGGRGRRPRALPGIDLELHALDSGRGRAEGRGGAHRERGRGRVRRVAGQVRDARREGYGLGGRLGDHG